MHRSACQESHCFGQLVHFERAREGLSYFLSIVFTAKGNCGHLARVNGMSQIAGPCCTSQTLWSSGRPTHSEKTII